MNIIWVEYHSWYNTYRILLPIFIYIISLSNIYITPWFKVYPKQCVYSFVLLYFPFVMSFLWVDVNYLPMIFSIASLNGNRSVAIVIRVCLSATEEIHINMGKWPNTIQRKGTCRIPVTSVAHERSLYHGPQNSLKYAPFSKAVCTNIILLCVLSLIQIAYKTKMVMTHQNVYWLNIAYLWCSWFNWNRNRARWRLCYIIIFYAYGIYQLIAS